MTTKVAPCSAIDGAQALLQIAEHGQVDAAGRLVEQHEPRPGHEGHGGVEQLLLAIGEPARLGAARWPSLKKLDHLLRLRRSARHRGPEEARQHRALMLLSGEDQVLAHGQLGEDLQQLEGAADAEQR
jgi:hypothetical protein